MIQTEAERQFYLGMSGIRMWYSRSPLPGAAPSPDYDFSTAQLESGVVALAEPPVVKSTGTRRPPVDPANKDRLAQLKHLMDAAPGKVESVAPEPEEEYRPPEYQPTDDRPDMGSRPESPAPAVLAEENVVRLSLQSWTGRRVALVANLSEEASFALQDSLAANILRSLGESAPKRSEVIRWPLFNNLKVSINGDAELSGLIAQELSPLKEKLVITLGLTSGAGAVPAMLSDVLGKAPAVGFAPSLAAVAGDPSLKKELWQSIRELADAT